MNSPRKSTGQAEYKYTKLGSVKSGITVNVYGVVKFVKPVYKSRGSDYSMMVSLVDETLHENDQKLKCLLFHREKDKLPYLQVGNIIRLHRLKITQFGGQLQGQSGPGFSWLVFSGDQGASLDPSSASSLSYTKTEAEKKTVEELREWCATQETMEITNCLTLEDIIPQNYFDLYCQVVATCSIEENTCFLLRVWDGTKPIYPLRDFDLNREECVVQSKPSLLQRAEGFIVDVALYDNHYKTGSQIKAGQYIKLCNLHAPMYKNPQVRQDLAALPMLELVIHKGTSYGRGVCVLNEDFPEVKKLCERLNRVVPSPTKRKNNEDLERRQGQSSSPKKMTLENKSDNARTESRLNKSCGIINQSQNREKSCEQSDILSDTSRCMLQTSTVVVNHPHVKLSKIRDVINHSVPYKFRILGHVDNYFPKPEVAEDIIKLYCPDCHHLQSLPNNRYEISHPAAKSREGNLVVSRPGKKVKHYFCPYCTDKGQVGTDRDPDDGKELEYIFMVRFLIRDRTGWIIANLWRQDAVTFFKDILPIEVLSSEEEFREVKEILKCLNTFDTERDCQPLFECCVKSYTVKDQTFFQIFDTCSV